MPPTYTTGTHPEGWDNSGLPKSVREYLANGAEKGNRDNALFRAACQFRDAGYAQADAEGPLIARALADGLTEKVARAKIRSAYGQAPRQPAGSSSHATVGGGAVPPQNAATSQPGATATPLPAPLAEGFRIFLETVFEDGERVAIGQGKHDADGDLAIDYGDTRLRKMWLKAGPPQNPLGVFARINPMQYRGAKNEHVTAFRHTLVEFDCDKNGNLVPKEIQYAALVGSGFPLRVILDSGNKSLQSLVAVDAINKHQYEERVDIVYAHFRQYDFFDAENKAENKYCRLPGCERQLYDQAGKPTKLARQELLAIKLGTANWSEWEKNQAAAQRTKRDELKSLLKPLLVTDLPSSAPQQLIEGMLYQGGKMAIGGGSKTFKSWNLLHLLFCLANGLPYFGFPTARIRVVLFDFELLGFDCRHRLERIAHDYGLGGEAFDNLLIVPLRGRYIDFADPLTQEVLVETINETGAALYGLDPLYKVLGHHDENSNSDVARVLRPFETLTVECGCSLLYNQHYSKGNQAAKDPIDRIAGGGSFGRDPDVILTFTKHEVAYAYTVNVTQRSFKEIDPFVVRWSLPVFIRDDSLDPEALAQPPKTGGRPKDFFSREKIMAALYGAESAGGLDFARLQFATQIARRSLYQHLAELIGKGEAIKSAVDKTYQLSPRNAQKWQQAANP